MVDILHKVGVEATSPTGVYDALTTVDGLADWWTTDTDGEAGAGGTVRFRFANGSFAMEVVEAVPDERVRWRVVDGPEEWVGTSIDFDLEQVGDHTVVRFSHRDWREPVDFMHHCSTKWATYLLSLKALVETGTGAPHPDDVKVDSWD